MKTWISRNTMKRLYDRIWFAGNAKYPNLLARSDAIYYNFGTFGWNYDVFYFGHGTAFTDGDRAIGAPCPPEVEARMAEIDARIAEAKSRISYHHPFYYHADFLKDRERLVEEFAEFLGRYLEDRR